MSMPPEPAVFLPRRQGRFPSWSEIPGAGKFPHMSETLYGRIRERLESLGLSDEAAARKAGLQRDYLRNLKRNRQISPRGQNLARLAAVLGCSVDELIDGIAPTPVAMTERRIALPIRYEAAAGAWAAVDEFADEAPTPETAAAIDDPAFRGLPQWLERVRGDSYNLRIPDGALVHVVDAVALEYGPRSGDTVIVVRSRAEGAFRERTLKEVEVTRSGVKLWPRSHNPKWSAALDYTAGLRDAQFEEVRIEGLVIRAYIDFAN